MKLFLSIMSAVLLFTNAQAQEATPASNPENKIITAPAEEEHLLDNKIYFFAHSMCQTCKDAFVYLYTNHADLEIPITDMKFHHNFELYKECVQKFGVSNKELRLPLICIGNHYIMGWDETSGPHFEEYLKEFQSTLNPQP